MAQLLAFQVHLNEKSALTVRTVDILQELLLLTKVIHRQLQTRQKKFKKKILTSCSNTKQ